MRSITFGMSVAALCVILLKLFTFEFYYADDPTCGVALRLRPGWESRIRVTEQTQLKARILVEDENDFRGRWVYQLLTGWAGLSLVIGAGALLLRQRLVTAGRAEAAHQRSLASQIKPAHNNPT